MLHAGMVRSGGTVPLGNSCATLAALAANSSCSIESSGGSGDWHNGRRSKAEALHSVEICRSGSWNLE